MAKHEGYNSYTRRGKTVGSRSRVRSVRGESLDKRIGHIDHKPDSGWTSRLTDIAKRVNMSAAQLGICLDFLGLREERLGSTGRLFYAFTKKAKVSKIARHGAALGVWAEWHIDSVCVAVSRMTAADMEKAIKMRKAKIKSRKEAEGVAEQKKKR